MTLLLKERTRSAILARSRTRLGDVARTPLIRVDSFDEVAEPGDRVHAFGNLSDQHAIDPPPARSSPRPCRDQLRQTALQFLHQALNFSGFRSPCVMAAPGAGNAMRQFVTGRHRFEEGPHCPLPAVPDTAKARRETRRAAQPLIPHQRSGRLRHAAPWPDHCAGSAPSPGSSQYARSRSMSHSPATSLVRSYRNTAGISITTVGPIPPRA